MRCNLMATALAAAVTIAAPTPALANGHHHTNGYHHRKHPIALRGYGTPICDRHHCYFPAFGYDPDPDVKANYTAEPK
jgi:hypothetical protein